MNNTLRLLRFEDWIKSRDISSNWITIAQSRKIKEDNIKKEYFTISILADKCNINKIIKSHEWITEVDFGNPKILSYNDNIEYSPDYYFKWNDITIQPFIIHREWPHKSSKFELIQDFILFYNLYWDSKEKVFRGISETGEEFEVIRVNMEKDKKQIEINTKFLRNYLAIKSKILIRQHDHARFTSESVKSLIGKEWESINLTSGEYNYKITLNENPCSSCNSFSRLLGKDIIRPYEKGQALLEWRKEKFCSFIIGIDKEGNEIEEICDENQLSNYFVNRGKPQSLTPVFFRREVLKKYYDTPSKFTVTSNSVNCSGLWLIPIDITDKDLVQVWLGDLGRIPFKEQQHWRRYNVVPEGNITLSRFRRDFMAEFADPEDIMFKFKKALDDLNKAFKKKFNFNLFLPLKHEDEYIYNTLRIPVNNEQPEFDEQIKNLAKLLPDSIDIKSIKENLRSSGISKEDIEKIEDKKIKGLEIFIQKHGLNTDLIDLLDLIQNIRSSCIAHRRGKNCIKLLKKYNLSDKSNIHIFKKLINDLIESLNKLRVN